jgi:hypothetical protein
MCILIFTIFFFFFLVFGLAEKQLLPTLAFSDIGFVPVFKGLFLFGVGLFFNYFFSLVFLFFFFWYFYLCSFSFLLFLPQHHIRLLLYILLRHLLQWGLRKLQPLRHNTCLQKKIYGWFGAQCTQTHLAFLRERTTSATLCNKHPPFCTLWSFAHVSCVDTHLIINVSIC